jgi:hypothetical protein
VKLSLEEELDNLMKTKDVLGQKNFILFFKVLINGVGSGNLVTQMQPTLCRGFTERLDHV